MSVQINKLINVSRLFISLWENNIYQSVSLSKYQNSAVKSSNEINASLLKAKKYNKKQ